MKLFGQLLRKSIEAVSSLPDQALLGAVRRPHR
jgi:hypothetical protein